MAEKTITHRKNTPIKKRSQSCYQKKVDKITKWYNHLLEERKQDTRMENKQMINPNTKQEPKRKELRPLNYYIEKITKVK